MRYSIFKLIKELNNYKPDTIISTLGHLNLVLLAVRPFIKGKPKIIVREANTPSKTRTKTKGFKRFLFSKLYKSLYPTADKIVAQCEDMKLDFIDTYKIDSEKIIYIYNPIDIKYIKEKSIEFNPYKDDYINIIAVGRLTYQKGFDILISAFKEVTEKLPNVRLNILGEGELLDSLNKQIKDLGLSEKVSILGFKENPYPYYKNADLFVLSSRWEGFPNVLLEALACGAKVVATNCKSGPREILGDNEYGTLVEVENIKDLASGIINALKSPNKSSERAKIFDISNIMEYYTDILK